MRASIVIPTKNRLRSLAALLESLSILEPVEGGHEIVVVNDGGASVNEVAGRFGARVAEQGPQGVAAARNLGAREARGELLLFTDDDCLAHPAWARRLSERLGQAAESLVIGRVVNGLPSNKWAEANQRLHDVVVEWFNAQTDQPGFFTGNNFAIRREGWLSAGGMDEKWRVCGGEEREFVQRWAARGGRVIQEPLAIVSHCHALTARGFMDQQFRYGRGARYASRGWPLRFELYGRILTAAPDWPGRARLAASQAAVAAGWAYEAVARLTHKNLCF